MSKFISSYFSTTTKKNKMMKLYSRIHTNQWSVFPLPFAYVYFETCNPQSHFPLLKNKICGLYLSFNWLKWTYNIGVFKPIN